MIESTFSLGDRKLHAASLDNGLPPLLLFHGVTRRWQTFLPLMPTLGLRWSVFAFDHRGHGQSSRTPGQYLVTDYVRDVVDIVKQFDQPVVLAGHSLGGMAVAGAAAELGDRVRAVIMEDPPMHTMGTRIKENLLLSFFGGLSKFAGDPRSLREIATDLAEIELFDPVKNLRLRMGDLRDAVALRFNSVSLKHADPDVFTPILAGEWLRGFDIDHVFRSISVPQLLMQADVDAGGMLTDADAGEIAGLSPDLCHIKMAGIGHVIHLSATQLWLNHVVTFLESLR